MEPSSGVAVTIVSPAIWQSIRNIPCVAGAKIGKPEVSSLRAMSNGDNPITLRLTTDLIVPQADG
jgi:hypothetical protein